jgi:hypothetical protein
MATNVKKNESEKPVPVSFSAKGKAAIHNEATLIIAHGKQAMLKLKPHIAAYRADRTYVDNVEAVLNAVRNEVNAYREPRGDKPMATIRKQRVSDFRTCVRMADWKCCDDVLDMFAETAMTDDDVLVCARYLVDNVDKKAKAPKREDIVAAIKDRRYKKTGRGDGETKTIDPSKAIVAANKLATGWRAWVAEQPALKKRRSEINELINSLISTAGALEVIAKTAA